eukprot:3625330-Prymnesium_polylepis.1
MDLIWCLRSGSFAPHGARHCEGSIWRKQPLILCRLVDVVADRAVIPIDEVGMVATGPPVLQSEPEGPEDEIWGAAVGHERLRRRAGAGGREKARSAVSLSLKEEVAMVTRQPAAPPYRLRQRAQWVRPSTPTRYDESRQRAREHNGMLYAVGDDGLLQDAAQLLPRAAESQRRR